MDKKLIDFFLEVGKVKRMKQRGLVLREVKDPAVVGGHSFRTAIMAWVIARSDGRGLDTNRLIKLILLHDLVGGYAGDLTPYESLISKTTKKDLKSMYEKWVRIPKKKKERFARQQRIKEQKALGQLVRLLPKNVAAEMQSLWDEYEQRLTREGRFVHQIHMLENHLQSLEYWRKDKKFPIESWWQEVKELMSDPILIEFAKELDIQFHGDKKKRVQNKS